MEMELGIGTEEFLNDASHIAKGKRTKRHKPFSPCDVAAITSSSSSANDSASFSSTTTFQDEEQDMANCLILLAQGKTGGEETDDDEEDNKMREKSRRISEVTTTATTKIGFYIYECKTCNRTFPSFQALGGHRASHKKPKVTSDDKKKPQPQPQPQPNTLALITNCDFEETKQVRVMTTSPPISLQLGYGGATNNNNGKPKIHECSICGSEFTSGQALGGHMRRHRTAVITTTSPQPTCDVPARLEVVKPPRNLLELDLNLPAPADDDHHHRDSQFQFSSTQKTMMLSAAPPLVDCHY
ncbi:hypothetical protein S83_025718 [Arachis hypogaea]